MSDSQLISPMSSVQVIFNRIAPVYDQLNDWLSFGQHRVWKLMTVKWSNPQPGYLGLDLCCGSGDLTQLLAKQLTNTGQVYGVDFSSQLLAIARKRSEQYYPPLPIEWIQADVMNLPFADNYFDCSTMGYGLRNVTDIPRCLRELHRVLKPHAKAAILDMHRPNNVYVHNFQQWYLQNLVVPVAEKFNVIEEYAYIAPSLDKFPTGLEQIHLARQAGFTHAIHYPIAAGMMGVLVLTK